MDNNYLVFGAVVLGLISTFIPKETYAYIWALISPKKKVNNQDIVFTVTEPVKEVVNRDSYEIHEIVEQWSTLKKMLKNENLNEAIKSLDDVFLKLLNKNEKPS